MTCARSALLAMLIAYAAAARAQDADWLWIDGFEQDAISAFRFTTLALRDPHVFLQSLAQCFDFTGATRMRR